MQLVQDINWQKNCNRKKEKKRLAKGAYAKLHHDMQHFVTEASVEQL